MNRMIFIEASFSLLQDKLDSLVEQIRNAQQKKNGSIILRFVKCGKNCPSCPHPRWEKWVGGTMDRYRWHRVNIDSPLRHINGKNFPDDAKLLIRESVKLLEYRKKMVTQAALLANTCTRMAEHLSKNDDADGKF